MRGAIGGAITAAALIGVAGIMATITATTIADHKAQVIADLAAVAAAEADDCARASQVIAANGAETPADYTCTLDGDDAVVTYKGMSARAGPVTPAAP